MVPWASHLFSAELFRSLLSVYSRQPGFSRISRDARSILSLLEENSPQSTKQLKRATDLVGRALEPTYHRALQELWSRLLVVAFGEVDEGAFPSLAIGSTKLMFEELYEEALTLSPAAADDKLRHFFRSCPLAEKHHGRIMVKLSR